MDDLPIGLIVVCIIGVIVVAVVAVAYAMAMLFRLMLGGDDD